MKRFAALSLATAALLAACSPSPPATPVLTRGEVYDAYVARLKAKQASIAAVTKLEPGETFVQGLDPGAPIPTFDITGASPTPNNVAFFSMSRLFKKAEPEVPLYLSSPLDDALAILEQRTTMNRGDDDGEAFARDMEAAIATRYVGLYEITEFTEPRVTSETTVETGHLLMTIAIMDLDTRRAVTTCQAWAGGKDNVTQTPRDFRPMENEVKSELINQMRDVVLEHLGKCFADNTGGVFNLKSS